MEKNLLRRMYYALSPGLRLVARRIYYFPSDVLRRFRYRYQAAPPKGLIFTGAGDFEEVGKRYLEYFIEHAGLKPGHHVLDVGCGIGRMALPLTGYLLPTAQYEGFDIVEQGIRWCQQNISGRYPNFHFRHVNLANDLYVSAGDEASNFVFPYDDQVFDTVIVTSVFTHLTRKEMEHYLKEISRTTKTGGKVFATFFLLNAISREHMKEQDFRFDFEEDGCFLMDKAVKSANVAYDESDFRALCSECNFEVTQCFYGTWSGRSTGTLDFQDIVVLEKTAG